MSSFRVLITDHLAEVCTSILEARGLRVEYVPGLPAEALIQKIAEFDALIVRSATKVTAQIIEAGTRLKVIGRAGAGVDNIDLAAATRKGVAVLNVPGANTVSAAEHAFALMLALARKIPQAHQSLRSGEWNRSAFKGVELFGKTLGIIGLGKIGRELALRARAFGMKVVAYDPLIEPAIFADVGAKEMALRPLVTTSDIISIHVPINEETRRLIGSEELRLAKRTMMLINTSRGGVVDEDALYQALQSGRIAGAALDVFEKEPPFDSPLLRLPNVVVTPHLGASTDEAQRRVAEEIAELIADFLLDKKVDKVLNPGILSN